MSLRSLIVRIHVLILATALLLGGCGNGSQAVKSTTAPLSAASPIGAVAALPTAEPTAAPNPTAPAKAGNQNAAGPTVGKADSQNSATPILDTVMLKAGWKVSGREQPKIAEVLREILILDKALTLYNGWTKGSGDDVMYFLYDRNEYLDAKTAQVNAVIIETDLDTRPTDSPVRLSGVPDLGEKSFAFSVSNSMAPNNQTYTLHFLQGKHIMTITFSGPIANLTTNELYRLSRLAATEKVVATVPDASPMAQPPQGRLVKLEAALRKAGWVLGDRRESTIAEIRSQMQSRGAAQSVNSRWSRVSGDKILSASYFRMEYLNAKIAQAKLLEHDQEKRSSGDSAVTRLADAP